MATPLPGRETRRRKWESKLLLKRFSDLFPATTAEPSRDVRPKNSTPIAYRFVGLWVILLLTVGVYRFARLWVEERAASYAAVGAVLLGSLAILVYQSGQLPTTMAAALTLNALPYFYEWSRAARGTALLKGVLITISGAAVHHVTFLFGMVLFALPVMGLAGLDREREGARASVTGVISRAAIFVAIASVIVGVVLLPY